MTKNTPAKPATDRQAEVYRAILLHFAEQGRAPSIRDLMTRLAISSPNGVSCHLKALAQKGLICTIGRTARGIEIEVLSNSIKRAASELLAEDRFVV